MPPSELSPDPQMKLSGIATKLGEALELSGKKSSALLVYLQTLADLFPQFDIYPSTPSNLIESGYMRFGENGQLDKEIKVERKHPGWKEVEVGGRSRLRAVGLANRAAMIAEALQATKTIPPRSNVGWTRSWSQMELYLRTFSGDWTTIDADIRSIADNMDSHTGPLFSVKHDRYSYRSTLYKSGIGFKVRCLCLWP